MNIFIYMQLELHIARGRSAVTFAFEQWKVKSLNNGRWNRFHSFSRTTCQLQHSSMQNP